MGGKTGDEAKTANELSAEAYRKEIHVRINTAPVVSYQNRKSNDKSLNTSYVLLMHLNNACL